MTRDPSVEVLTDDEVRRYTVDAQNRIAEIDRQIDTLHARRREATDHLHRYLDEGTRRRREAARA